MEDHVSIDLEPMNVTVDLDIMDNTVKVVCYRTLTQLKDNVLFLLYTAVQILQLCYSSIPVKLCLYQSIFHFFKNYIKINSRIWFRPVKSNFYFEEWIGLLSSAAVSSLSLFPSLCGHNGFRTISFSGWLNCHTAEVKCFVFVFIYLLGFVYHHSEKKTQVDKWPLDFQNLWIY